MQKVTDYKPLDIVELPRLGKLTCAGLTVIVGPNSSGKSQLLRDLYSRIIGEPRSLVVASTIRIKKPDLDPLIDCLRRDGYLTSFKDDNDTEHIRPLTTHVGTGKAASVIPFSQSQNWLSSYSAAEASSKRPNQFLGYFGPLIVTALFLDRRLNSVSNVGSFDFETQPPQNDIQALYVDDGGRLELFNEIQATFGKSLWLDSTKGNSLCFRISNDPTMPVAEDRLSPKKMSAYRTIETEGDGLKSYVATCIALLLGRRPVCIVDEPEMCLHPPQAYNLGRFIGRFGASVERATFVATHSSHVLRGVIQATSAIQIVRLTRRGDAFEAHLVPSVVLSEILRRPTVRAETVLDGIFSQAVIVLEADGDRTVYQAAYETLVDEYKLDIHFTPVGGTGGIADTCRLYRTLRIPIAVIVDLDIFADPDRLEKIASSLVDQKEAERLATSARAIANAIKATPPTVTEDEIRSKLAEVLNHQMSWSAGDDQKLRASLGELATALDRMRRLKRGGIAALPAETMNSAKELLLELGRIGLFVVPVGELEEWLSGYDVHTSKSNKWAWANEAAAKILAAGPKNDDIWIFVRSIVDFLRGSLR